MTRVAVVYAQALYELGKDEGICEQLLEEMSALGKAFVDEPDFLRLLSAPSLSKEERCRIIDDSFGGKIHEYLLNFLLILTEKRYIGQYFECCEAYQKLYQEDHNILTVNAVTAVPLAADQADRLSAKLAKITGKTIDLHNQIDPACLGGVRLDYDGIRVDDTLAHRLDALRSMLKNTIL